ncbi:hypothetical protein U9I18_000124 [Bacillus phage KKP_4048]|nr:putative class lb ribonucleoside-diphosphate reductase assembly flavoprotein Nrdl [Bacillus phage vB_BspH_Mawwa]QXN70825.1 putative class Ib ribonucleoside-diphosphate reductase assembly flavoprotein NrdI [Bacillus phage vB_BspH_TimeGriffin]
MLITYESLTGNVRRFVTKLKKLHNVEVKEIHEGLEVNEPFVHITYTVGFGQVPPKTSKFIENNKKYLKGVVSSGNRNWGEFFGAAGDKLSSLYNVPLLLKIELSGTPTDIERFMQEVEKIDK